MHLGEKPVTKRETEKSLGFNKRLRKNVPMLANKNWLNIN